MRIFIIIVVAIAFTAIFTNLIIIDIALYQPKNKTATRYDFSTQPNPTPIAACPTSCTDLLSQVKQTVVATSQPTPTNTPVNSTTIKPFISEVYVPLGTGSTQNNQWEDVTGAESYIDTANYPILKVVNFEVSMHIPTKNGIVSARLFNVTDKHPVWFSDVSTDSDVGILLTSAAISLDKGNKLYRVQIKTSLQYPSLLDFARVKIQFSQ